eukprot:4204040-Pyramimonas_sp.AAC.2
MQASADTRGHISVTMLTGCPVMTSFNISPAWSMAVHVHAGMPGGFVTGSVYPESVGASGYLHINYGRLTRLAAFLCHYA